MRARPHTGGGRVQASAGGAFRARPHTGAAGPGLGRGAFRAHLVSRGLCQQQPCVEPRREPRRGWNFHPGEEDDGSSGKPNVPEGRMGLQAPGEKPRRGGALPTAGDRGVPCRWPPLCPWGCHRPVTEAGSAPLPTRVWGLPDPRAVPQWVFQPPSAGEDAGLREARPPVRAWSVGISVWAWSVGDQGGSVPPHGDPLGLGFQKGTRPWGRG